MIPQIIQIGEIPINSFGLMIACAFLAGIYLLGRSFELNGISGRLAEKYVLLGGFVGLLGARILFVIDHLDQYKDDPWGALFSSSGFTFYGGFILSTIVLIGLSRLDKIKLSSFLDSTGPTLALAYAIGRLGCQLAGDGDYGIATESVFGMSYATGVIATPPGVLAFPTPLYESVMCLMILWVLLRVESAPAWQVPYRRFSLYLMLIAPERFLIEFLRINPRIAFGLSEAQLIAIAIFIVGVILYTFTSRKGLEPRQT